MKREFPPARSAARKPAVRERVVLPLYAPGMRIGLFGGTFDPPHAAHRAACLLALRRLGLDRVWWLVTPGNPLKDTRGLAPLAERVAAAERLAHHPLIDVTDLEAELGTSYTYETVSYLVRRCRGVHFVWIMGADNLRSFHRWQRWRGIAGPGSNRCRRPSWPKSLFNGQRCKPGTRPVPAAGNLGNKIGRSQAAGVGLFARSQIAAVVDGAACGTRVTSSLNDICLTAKQLKPLTRHAYLKAGAPDSVAGAA